MGLHQAVRFEAAEDRPQRALPALLPRPVSGKSAERVISNSCWLYLPVLNEGFAMNIKEAKAIPMAVILEKIGYQPVKEKGHKAVYSSPLRAERTPSFHVNNAMNAWYDFGEGKGGNVVDFTCAYLASQKETNSISDALHWLSRLAGVTSHITTAYKPTFIDKEPSLVVKKTSSIQHKALLNYLTQRRIPLSVATPHLVQVFLYNPTSSKSFFALGMKNEEDGFELRNPFFKGSAGQKTISFIRGMVAKPSSINLFEGSFDYLSALAYQKVNRFADDTIILHSLSLISHALPYITNYGYRNAFTWLDNDTAGTKATHLLADFFATEDGLQHKPMNAVYAGHKDVNAWHISHPFPDSKDKYGLR